MSPACKHLICGPFLFLQNKDVIKKKVDKFKFNGTNINMDNYNLHNTIMLKFP